MAVNIRKFVLQAHSLGELVALGTLATLATQVAQSSGGVGRRAEPPGPRRHAGRQPATRRDTPAGACARLVGIERGGSSSLTMFNGGCYRKGSNSSPVLARNPTRSPGRYCIRLSRVFTRTVSSAMVCLVRLASDRFRCDHTDSTGLSSWAYGGSR